MARLVVHILIGITVLTLIHVSCDETMEVIFRRIREIDRDILDIRNKLVSNIDFAIASVKSDLNQQIEQQVLKAMAEILQDEPIEEMRSDSASEMRKLKHGFHQMKRQLKYVMKSRRDVMENRETCLECLLNAGRNASELKTCSKYIADSRRLQRDLEQCSGRRGHLRMEIKELKHSVNALNKTCQSQHTTHGSTAVATTTERSTQQPTTVQSATTTEKPENGSRIILAPYYSDVIQPFRQLNIQSNSVKTYPYLNHEFTLSLAYSFKLRKLFTCVMYPARILSSNLDMHGVKTIKKGKQPPAMAVDEDRELIFMTTDGPKSIARMTTRGKHFRTVSHWDKYDYPWAIAVNAKEMKMYVCDLHKVFMVTYDGRYMQTLAEGSSIYAVTLDNTGSFLYYGDGEKLVEISLSDNSTSVVTSVGSPIWNLVHYNNSVYFSRYNNFYVSSTSVGQVGVGYGNVTNKSVGVGYENVTYKSYPVNTTNVLGLSMCLVI